MQKTFLLTSLILVWLALGSVVGANEAGGSDPRFEPTLQTRKLPRLLDFGAHKCQACKMMEPVLAQLAVEYHDVFTVEFIDVWQSKNRDRAKNNAIRMIPTQIFLDSSGREIWRHVGFISKADILKKWREFGVFSEPGVKKMVLKAVSRVPNDSGNQGAMVKLKKIITVSLIAFAVISAVFAVAKQVTRSPAALREADFDKNSRVVVYNMHSTFRCASCNRIELMTRELLDKAYAQELAQGLIQWQSVDYQEDIALAKKFAIDASCVVVAAVSQSQIVAFKRLDQVWTLMNNRPAFNRYIAAAIDEFRYRKRGE